MNQTTAKAELSTLLSDTLSQVSADRLSAAITSAWRDGYVATQVYDDTTTFADATYEYAIPSTVTTVESISVQATSSLPPDPLDSGLWEVIDGNIHFNSRITNYVSSGNTLVIKGKYKLEDSDDIPDEYPTLQEYVVTLAASKVLRQLGFSKSVAFLNNDTSMAELIGFKREIDREVKELRAQLQTNYMDN